MPLPTNAAHPLWILLRGHLQRRQAYRYRQGGASPTLNRLEDWARKTGARFTVGPEGTTIEIPGKGT